jgi:hypothetical protein
MVVEEAEAAVARVEAERTRMGTAAAEEAARAVAATAAARAVVRVAAARARWEMEGVVGDARAAAARARTARAAARATVVRTSSATAREAAATRAETIANLDILHRQQMLGTWPAHINSAAITEQIHQATPSVIAEKQEVKKHMGSMLGDWDNAGKLSKRRIRKTKMKTKRRRQKITKRRRK